MISLRFEVRNRGHYYKTKLPKDTMTELKPTTKVKKDLFQLLDEKIILDSNGNAMENAEYNDGTLLFHDFEKDETVYRVTPESFDGTATDGAGTESAGTHRETAGYETVEEFPHNEDIELMSMPSEQSAFSIFEGEEWEDMFAPGQW